MPVPKEMRGDTISARFARLLVLGAGIMLLPACKQPPEGRYVAEAEAMTRGKATIEAAGCAACHVIPGIDWPQGRLGPSLAEFDDFGLIAGSLSNNAANLAQFVRDAPAAKPGSTMPAMPLSQEEALDVAAYLYGMNDA